MAGAAAAVEAAAETAKDAVTTVVKKVAPSVVKEGAGWLAKNFTFAAAKGISRFIPWLSAGVLAYQIADFGSEAATGKTITEHIFGSSLEDKKLEAMKNQALAEREFRNKSLAFEAAREADANQRDAIGNIMAVQSQKPDVANAPNVHAAESLGNVANATYANAAHSAQMASMAVQELEAGGGQVNPLLLAGLPVQ